MKLLKYTILGLIFIIPFYAQAQNGTSIANNYKIVIDEKRFNESLFDAAIVDAINAEREKLSIAALDSSSILQKACADYVQFLAQIDDAKPGLGGKKQTAEYRLKQYGGAANAF